MIHLMKRFANNIGLLVKLLAILWLMIICAACSTQPQTTQVSAEVTSPAGTPSLPTEVSGGS